MIILVKGRNKTRLEREGEEGNFNGRGANKNYQQTNKHLDTNTYRKLLLKKSKLLFFTRTLEQQMRRRKNFFRWQKLISAKL